MICNLFFFSEDILNNWVVLHEWYFTMSLICHKILVSHVEIALHTLLIFRYCLHPLTKSFRRDFLCQLYFKQHYGTLLFNYLDYFFEILADMFYYITEVELGLQLEIQFLSSSGTQRVGPWAEKWGAGLGRLTGVCRVPSPCLACAQRVPENGSTNAHQHFQCTWYAWACIKCLSHGSFICWILPLYAAISFPEYLEETTPISWSYIEYY